MGGLVNHLALFCAFTDRRRYERLLPQADLNIPIVSGVSSKAVMPSRIRYNYCFKAYGAETHQKQYGDTLSRLAFRCILLHEIHLRDARPVAIGNFVGGAWCFIWHNRQEGGGKVQIPIDEIQVRDGRRELNPDHAGELSESIRELGLLNPITVDKEHFLIAGLHRLEAVKLLDWSEVECSVCSLEGLQAELAEIDENFVRNDLSALEYGEMLLRRKEIYEILHPETKVGVAQAVAMNKAVGNNVSDILSPTSKSFVQDTAEKLGVVPRTIERQIQTAKNLIPEAKEIIKDAKISKKSALQISRLQPDQQKEAASLLVTKEIKSVDEYKATKAPPVPKFAPSGEQDEPAGDKIEDDTPTVPFSLPQERYASFKEVVADLKNPDKDCSCSPDSFLAEFTAFVRKYIREIEWYSNPYYQVVFPSLSQEQHNYLHQQIDSIGTVNRNLLNQIERNMKL